jgi:hypothetical protein
MKPFYKKIGAVHLGLARCLSWFINFLILLKQLTVT